MKKSKLLEKLPSKEAKAANRKAILLVIVLIIMYLTDHISF